MWTATRITRGNTVNGKLRYMYILVGGAVLLFLWSLVGYLSSNVEQAEYTVVRNTGVYEVREYAPHIEAQTTVQGSFTGALNNGFSIVAAYIFGANQSATKIAMTAPVQSQGSSEKIAMTAPVLSSADGDTRTIAFVMPKEHTLASLPKPTDDRVRLVEVPVRTVAVLQFSWGRSNARVAKMEERLLAALTKDGVRTKGAVTFAGYNAPWTPPWMVRNEVLVEIE